MTEYYLLHNLTLVNAKLPYLLPPFVLQAFSEATTAYVEGLIPRYLTSSCLTAQRDIMCSLSFMSPHAIDSLFAIFGTVYLPEFPANEICNNYMDQCAGLVALVPALGFNCSAKAGTIDLFPKSNQVCRILSVQSSILIFTFYFIFLKFVFIPA